ncbi:MAG: glycosyltransferase family 2 protein [Kiritimatiellia bacterium]|jgi:glycosyltransferase involved in cell wall biosynthesis
MKLSVVIPCLNESATLEAAIGLAQGLVSAAGGDGEIVVSDNGSTDGSQKIAESCGARVVNAPRKGYGFALLHGIRDAKGDIIVMGDADATYDFREAAPLVESIARGECDLAMGSRLRGKIEKGAMPFLHRYLGTPVLTFLIRVFFGLPITDCNCGLRAFSKDAFEKMNLVSGGMEFASEMLIKAAKAKLRVTETPVSLAKDIRDREPHLNTWRDGWRHLRFILLMAPHVVFRIPGWILTSFFGLATVALSFGPVTIGRIVFDYHHLFYTVPLFAVGIQLLWFSSFADRFRSFIGLEEVEQARFPLDKWLIAGGLLVIAGIAVFAVVASKWLSAGRGELFAVREGAISLALFIAGLLSIMNSLMVSMLELHVETRRKQ